MGGCRRLILVGRYHYSANNIYLPYGPSAILSFDAIHVGYWCFEAALVAMLWNIDDTAVAGHPHYPVDLVRHYRITAPPT